jgi:hypothetical protein
MPDTSDHDAPKRLSTMGEIRTTLPLLARPFLTILALLPLLGSVGRRRLVRVARVLPELLEKLGYLLLQRCDPPPLLGDDRILSRQLGLELCDSIVSPITLYAHHMIELRSDGKNFRIYRIKWITYAATRRRSARLQARRGERLRRARPAMLC